MGMCCSTLPGVSFAGAITDIYPLGILVGHSPSGWRDVVPVRLALGTLELLYIARTLSIFFLHFLGVMVNHVRK